MIIVSQDKDTIINFDNVEDIYILADLEGSGEKPYKIYCDTSSLREAIGKYKTEERAKKVLGEIINKYLEFMLLRNSNGHIQGIEIKPKVYTMPEDDEEEGE